MNKTQDSFNPDLQPKNYLRLNELKFQATTSNTPFANTSQSPTHSTINILKNLHQDNLSSNYSSTNFSNSTRAQLWMVISSLISQA